MKQTPKQGTKVYPIRLFQVLFFPSTLNNCFNLDRNIRNFESVSIFKRRLFRFIGPVETSIYNIFDPKSLAFLTCLRLGLSHLNEQRIQDNVQKGLIPLRSFSLEISDTSHYLLHCQYFSHDQFILMNNVKLVCHDFDSMSGNVKENLLLYSDSGFDENRN